MAARTNVTTSRVAAGDFTTDMTEAAVAIDAANGMRVVIGTIPQHVAIRITNTHASPHPVTVPAVQGAGNGKGQHGAAGPSGSYPSEPDFVSVAIPATTGVRWLALPMRYFRSDGSFWLNFEAAHTGFVSAVEFL
jgi:hypothetical protein